MRLNRKMTLTLLSVLLLNVAALLVYYNVALSQELSQDFELMQRQLEERTARMAQDLPLADDVQAYLERQCAGEALSLSLEDASGRVLYRVRQPDMASLSLNAAHSVQLEGGTLLLRATRQLPIANASALKPVRSLLMAELLFLIAILLPASIVIYLLYTRPIEALHRAVEQYGRGIRPQPVRRSDEIGQLQNSFVRLTCELEQEKQVQTRIIASISHDIKTPLTSVLGYAEQLQRGMLSPERAQRYTAILYDKAQAIESLIGEFDDYLSLKLQSALKRQSLPVGQLLKLVEANYQEELEGLGVELTVSTSCPNALVSVDAGKMQRVFGNLIGNSLKHFRSGERRIQVRSGLCGQRVAFRVEDNGTGIAPELCQQIFEPLYTSDEGRSVAGLGLSIVKQIVESHGGSVRAETVPAGGLAICFELPLASQEGT